MSRPRLRFAPSPTGWLHIGGARTALFNWLWARKTGGSLILRIEDTDQARSTAASLDAILASLTWLGLDWDEGPVRQMDRLALYTEWTGRLIRANAAYRCYCTENELAAQRAALAQRDPTARFRYPGTCRDRTDEPDLPHVIRFKADPNGSVSYVDKVFGPIDTPNTEMQDSILVRSDGVPLLNFAVVVDDITMGITLVARGRDHMVNTPLQILLYRAFGAPVPEFAHLPMMLGADGEKLSKRHGAVSVTEYRDLGYTPDAVLDYLARFGWSSGEYETRMSRDQLVAAFDWKQCSTSDGMFDPRKFLAISHDHLKSNELTPDPEYARLALPFVQARGLAHVTAGDVMRALPAVRERARTLVDAADQLDPFFRDPPALDERAAAKYLVKSAAPLLRGLHDVLASSAAWTAPALETCVSAWLGERQLALRDIGQPARVALTGRATSPSLFDVLALLGRETALARLARASHVADARA